MLSYLSIYLSMLGTCAESCKNATSRTIAVKGGIDATLAAMQQHPDSTAVQEKGCRILGSVVRYCSHSITIAKKGLVEAVFDAMTQHSHHEQVDATRCSGWWFCHLQVVLCML